MQQFNRASSIALFLLASICAHVSVTFAQSGREPSKVAPGAGPQLHVSTKSTTYRIGELLPLELSFSSATPKHYQINMARYDRSGRMSYERFVVSPCEGTHDPLDLVFNSKSGISHGGVDGLRFPFLHADRHRVKPQ
jgi:hypothetical protein